MYYCLVLNIKWDPHSFFQFTLDTLALWDICIVAAIDGCVVYKVLNEKNRAAGYDGSLANCDQGALITPAWYRFSGDAGVKMADSCVQKSHCGTHAPGWFNGSLPSNVGETVVGTVCFHWSSSCCKWSVKIRVKKCNGSYYVYELERTPVCHLRYCGNSGLGKNA